MQASTYVSVIKALAYIDGRATNAQFSGKEQYTTVQAMRGLLLDIKDACDAAMAVMDYDNGVQLKLPAGRQNS